MAQLTGSSTGCLDFARHDMWRPQPPGSARVSGAGKGVLAIANFLYACKSQAKFVSARRLNPTPDACATWKSR